MDQSLAVVEAADHGTEHRHAAEKRGRRREHGRRVPRLASVEISVSVRVMDSSLE
ncbi:hypothetical protein CU044_5523 [Streptomyces sp. L-9-10]|uniref:hypothetical protein n=1 Tax=Streptomyces sp. L-9-10 TaxID=1478131 RepID=UPI0010EC22CA|nr:hypothetical protein [Streptomyces sp. L-9-10]RYJ23218.1 hypothetical protein CU044_5523 [Streptomyces sp. L-9-10]